MQSLRTRRPSQSNKPQRNPSKLSKLGSSSSSKDARKSRVDDRIKKRMSMRYADISGPTDASVPTVPSLPIGTRPGTGGGAREEKGQGDSGAGSSKRERERQEDPRIAERKMLDKEDFDPDAYLKVKLANSTESQLKSLQSSLRSSKDDVASDLQRNVFKNYAEFVLISKEISVLENEMLELKESLAEWKSMPSLLHIDESASAAERRRNARSSIADLRVLYANQMQTLHSQIEGSAKFAPTTAGRHVVTEMDGILALNAATYKVDHGVKFVVLDDSVLVAKRRRNRNASGKSGSGKLVAERCWPLSEMLVLDTKDSANMTNVFKIRHGKETHVYRTENASDKKTLLSQFRQVAEELAAKKRKEREGEHERRKTLWEGGDRASFTLNADKGAAVPDWMADLTHRAGGDGSGAKEKAERDARWVGEFADELTVAIALREWDQAVSFVEEGKAKLSTTPPLAAKLTPLTASLTNALLRSLALPTNRKSTAVNLITLLLRLNAGPAARSTFLAARTEVTRKHIRAIRFEGHIGMYINDLAMVVFTGIKHTADWFLASFKENEVASCFIEWAKQQIESYAQMFRKQVYSSDVESKTIEEAMQITYSQSRKLLQEYGLDFRFLLDELLVENPKVKAPLLFTFHANPISRQQDAMPTPRLRTPTPSVKSPIRSPAPPTPTSSSIRSRTPQPAPTTAPPPPPLASPQPRRTRSPPAESSPRLGRATAQTPANDQVRSPRSGRGSPAPPPRSTNRPGSSAAQQRPPPVAIPRREGMI